MMKGGDGVVFIMHITTSLLLLVLLLHDRQAVSALPVVDKGVFVIVGVLSCGDGRGYCILGPDCTVDKEFSADTRGHCDGLKTAFTPSAPFSCCQLVLPDNNSSIIMTSTTTTPSTTTVVAVASTEEEEEEEEDSSDGSSDEQQLSSNKTNTTTTTVSPPLISPTTTVYEEKTEINLEQSISLQVVCGNSYGPNSHQAPATSTSSTARVASQHLSSSCHVGALVRSPSSSYSLQDPGSFLCTGAMITRDYLLTSATCVSRLLTQELKLFRAVVGAKHLVHPSHGGGGGGGQYYRRIEEIRVHEGYSASGSASGGQFSIGQQQQQGLGGGGGSSYYTNGQRLRLNDIALVKLESLNGTLLSSSGELVDGGGSGSYCSICLPDPAQDFQNTPCSVTGYSHPPDSNDADGFLHEAPQVVESREHCNSTLLCASGEKAAEACFSPRDAGSPLSCTVDGSPKLAGIFSSGFHCGNHESPVYYTDIRLYLDWIRDYVV